MVQTTNFENLQRTSVYQHEQIKSDSVNQLLKSVCSYPVFISSRMEIEVVKDATTNTFYASITPGIYVQDNTLINFQNIMKEKDRILVQLNLPVKNSSVFIGSSYHHGTISEGINSRPTYATISKCNKTELGVMDQDFVPLYKITWLDYEGKNVKIERLVPSLKLNGCGDCDYEYIEENGFKVFGDNSVDRTEMDSIIWALIL